MFTDVKKTIPFQDKPDQDIKIIGEFDKRLLNYIGRLYKDLNGDTVDPEEVEIVVDALAAYKHKNEHTYLETLVHPEHSKGCKIPSAIPVPSNSFQLHNSVTLTTNNKGNLAILFNPFFLYDSTNVADEMENDDITYVPNYFSTFYVNNDNDLTGSQPNEGKFLAYPVGQGIPNVYDQYRLVSASVIVKYIGRMDITSGVIGGAIVFDETNDVGSDGNKSENGNATAINIVPNLCAKYSNFDLAMDSFYHQENLSIEGLRMLYFPIDNTYEEYTRLFRDVNATLIGKTKVHVRADEDHFKSGFNWMIYVLGAPPSTSCFKVDYYLNFECLPNASFLNYMPITPPCGHVSSAEKKDSIAIIQRKPIMKSNEEVIVSKKNNLNVWKQLKKAFQGALPSIGKLIAKGVISAIPYMKPGLAIAGTLLESASSLTKAIPNQLNPNMSIDLEDVE